jgi:hypothetical protein
MSEGSVNSEGSVDSQAIQSTITSLKEIVTIVTGLTITNSIVRLFTRDDLFSLSNVDFQSLLLFIVLLGNVIRFYHGNIRHLDTTYTLELGKGNAGDLTKGGGSKTAIDFFVILLQSIAFAIISFLIHDPYEYFAFFAGLLVIDVIWFLGAYQYSPDRKAFDHQKKWSLNNIISVFALLIVITTGSAFLGVMYAYVLLGILVINTAIDYTISWDFYFP